MLTTAGLALALTPRLKLAEQVPEINLEAMIPKQFGEWKADETISSILVSPEVKVQIDKVYSQTLTRNYISSQGERIMLSIAYGDDQSEAMQVHLPEACYRGQGFQITSVSMGIIDLIEEKLPVKKLIAIRDQRVEPITYWVMVGDVVVRGLLEQSLARVKYGLTGKVPTGILIRVSTISEDESQSYRIEEQFVRDMLSAVPVNYRKVLSGTDK